MRSQPFILGVRFGGICAVLAACLWVHSSLASMASIDGFASLKVVLASPSILVCATTTSGSAQGDLFALDTRSGALRWRTTLNGVVGGGTLIDSNTFCLVAKDSLEMRSLTSGKVVWST